MAWEKRNNSKYYYRKVRAGDTVSSVYLGKDLLAYKLSVEAHRQMLQNRQQQAKIDTEKGIDEALETNHKLIIAMAESILLLNGYRLHKGEWKRRHG